LQHVGFVDRRYLAPPFHGCFECNASDALNLIDRVPHRVESHRAAVMRSNPARLAEVETAEQFAHDQNIDAFYNFGAKWRGRIQGAVRSHRTQIGKAAQGLSQLQQTGLGAPVKREMVEFRGADSSEQYRMRRQ